MANSAPMTPPPPGWKPPAMLPGDEPGDWDRAADIAAAYGITLDEAAEVIRRTLTKPQTSNPSRTTGPAFGSIKIGVVPLGGYPRDPDPEAPLQRYGIAVDFRWWERPHRLYRRRAAKRTARELGILR